MGNITTSGQELCLPSISESPATLLLVHFRPYLNSSSALASTKTLHFTSFLYLIHMSCTMENSVQTTMLPHKTSDSPGITMDTLKGTLRF
ncbi:hypothetical protein Pmani_025287 [Petrolisthes manimaculis]|uniref:Uncharacterized protein n=1 Tax=Petrolisthes manimaculis TaxID=1843537 RepID=A0AAE1P7K5_9EUCA|nr:hypothetical protein Pmani_025287 [Petrolisthes manimaculis]